ncbi:uncharacterized protein LOC128663791 isoform X2 [Bombina bombina]|uniref:uncharacterized protein LOC128663791 isoform X2 n=1 Tax=Bombina bombina TaxID=8345 RepID=UPI00235AFDF9|nr:uncharacterized protein LOC128663791 isoform X2 [Bombina bombina]
MRGRVRGNSPRDFCVDQPQSLQSFPEESVTIPCKYAYPNDITNISSTHIILRAGNNNFCGDIIYNSTNNIDPRYKERLFVSLRLETRDVNITIQNITRGDSVNYCCRIETELANGTSEKWQNPAGTKLYVRDTTLIVDQPTQVEALINDTVKIPCHYRADKRVSNVSFYSVQWSVGKTEACDTVIYNSTTQIVHQNYKGRISLFGKELASLCIKHVTVSDNGWYCCSVEVMTENGKVTDIKRTNLKATEPKMKPSITQSKNILSSKPIKQVKIGCFVERPKTKVYVSLEVYWMAEKQGKDFAYHPNTDLIHPLYKDKTQLVNESDLLLNVEYDMDNTTFFCRVRIRRCLGNKKKIANFMDTILAEGTGTLLRVNDVPDPSSFKAEIGIAVGCVVIFLIIVVISVFYILKTKGERKQETINGQSIQVSEVPAEVEKEYENSKHSQGQPGEDYVIYSTVNHSGSTQGTPKVSSEPDPASEIVYAAVKRD